MGRRDLDQETSVANVEGNGSRGWRMSARISPRAYGLRSAGLVRCRSGEYHRQSQWQRRRRDCLERKLWRGARTEHFAGIDREWREAIGWGGVARRNASGWDSVNAAGMARTAADRKARVRDHDEHERDQNG